MQEDKEAIFDAVDTLELCLKTVTPMLDTMKTLPANMRRAAAKGFINAKMCIRDRASATTWMSWCI